MDNLYTDRLDEKISVAHWEAKHKEIISEQEGIQNQTTKLKGEEARYFEIWLNVLDLAARAHEIYLKRTPEQRRVLLSHLFSNLVLKDDKVAYTLKTPVQKLAARVQKRLDAEKFFERQKSRSNKRLFCYLET